MWMKKTLVAEASCDDILTTGHCKSPCYAMYMLKICVICCVMLGY